MLSRRKFFGATAVAVATAPAVVEALAKAPVVVQAHIAPSGNTIVQYYSGYDFLHINPDDIFDLKRVEMERALGNG